MAKKKPQLTVSISKPSPTRRLEMVANDKTVTLYVNNAGVELSNWDVRIRLGLVQSAKDDVVTVLDTAHIYMTHEHAKAFAESLLATLQQLDNLKKKLDDGAKTIQ